MPKERIAKVIARAGIASRRKAEKLIETGKVKLNGKILREVATKVDPEEDKIFVNDEPLSFEKNITIALNKPRGYITSRSDTHDRKTVYALLPKKYHTLHSVGRLDKETSGLLLFTNDGSLTYQITHPKFEIRKKYQVSLRGKVKPEDIQKLEKGFKIPEFEVAPCMIENLSFDGKENKTRFLLNIGEGKKREIRKVFEYLHYDLLRLHRVMVGGLSISGIGMSKIKVLHEKEIKKIFETNEKNTQKTPHKNPERSAQRRSQ